LAPQIARRVSLSCDGR
jgi:hypothetical protein